MSGAPVVSLVLNRALIGVAAAFVLGAIATAAWIGAAAGAAGVCLATLGFGLGAALAGIANRAVRVAAFWQAVAEVDAPDDLDGADADRRTPVPA